jgi:deazaflavin-dependent oxidoreductase (nitroreductase family)
MIASLARRLGGTRVFALVGRAYMPVDRWLGRRSRGRLLALGLPSLLITTTGRQTGQQRTMPLLYAREGDDFVVIASNWGQPGHPGWSANLLANPQASVRVDGQDIAVRGRLVEGAERARMRQLLLELWPAYAAYERRAKGRELRLFRLEPTRPSTPELS